MNTGDSGHHRSFDRHRGTNVDSLRGVRQDTGAYHIIPRSSITTFANFVRGIGSVVANYDVDRHEDLDKASRALKAAVDDLLARRRSAV